MTINISYLLSLSTILLLLNKLNGQHLQSSSTWVKKNNGPVDWYSAASAVLNGKGYYGSGIKPATYGMHSSSAWWEYDPFQDKWTKKADLPKTFCGASAFNLNNRIFVGFGAECWVNNGAVQNNDLYEYDPEADTWNKKAPFPISGMGSCFSVNGKAYFVGGIKGTGTQACFTGVWEYDPVADSWTEKNEFPGICRVGSRAISIGNKGYVGFGTEFKTFWSTLRDLWEYDPSKDQWKRLDSCPGMTRTEPVMFGLGNYLFVGLGQHFGAGYYYDLRDFWKYDIYSNSWHPFDSLPSSALSRSSAFSFESCVYVLGGLKDSSHVKYEMPPEVWEYCSDEFISPHIRCPNVFTPNGDGINDIFEIKGINVASYVCEIFNRWGIRVARISDMNPTWDGKNCSDGVYFYVVQGKYKNGNSLNATGNLTLLR